MEGSKGWPNNFASPTKRLTPAVPTPIWHNEDLQVKVKFL